MTPPSEETTLAVIAVKLGALTDTVGELKAQLQTSGSVHVTRAEWMLRNEHVDAQLSTLRYELTRLEKLIDSKRVSWTSIAALAISALVVIISLAQNL